MGNGLNSSNCSGSCSSSFGLWGDVETKTSFEEDDILLIEFLQVKELKNQSQILNSEDGNRRIESLFDGTNSRNSIIPFCLS